MWKMKQTALQFKRITHGRVGKTSNMYYASTVVLNPLSSCIQLADSQHPHISVKTTNNSYTCRVTPAQWRN